MLNIVGGRRSHPAPQVDPAAEREAPEAIDRHRLSGGVSHVIAKSTGRHVEGGSCPPRPKKGTEVRVSLAERTPVPLTHRTSYRRDAAGNRYAGRFSLRKAGFV